MEIEKLVTVVHVPRPAPNLKRVLNGRPLHVLGTEA